MTTGQQVYAAVGTRIRQPLETPAQVSRVPPLEQVPPDVLAAQTGLQCIDAFVQKLHRTGWLHNHERMWLASWLVHVRGVRWQAGADWFLSHLLDGDPASNHLSWQWVAGTFSAKPYLFNRENLETFTSGVHCQPCGLRDSCPLDVSYEALGSRCFTADGPTERPPCGSGHSQPPQPGKPLWSNGLLCGSRSTRPPPRAQRRWPIRRRRGSS